MNSKKKSDKCNSKKFFIVVAVGIFSLFIQGCSTTRVTVFNRQLAEKRVKQPLLILTPVSQNHKLVSTCEKLENFYLIETPKSVDGPVVSVANIKELQEITSTRNIMRNGTIFFKEAALIGRTAQCDSVLVCHVLSAKLYPPFRMTIFLYWIDTHTGEIIGKLYQDINISDTDTKYKYSNFAGQGPVKELYETVFYIEDLKQTAMLSPNCFLNFVASYSTTVLFGNINSVPWYFFWRLL